MNLTDAVIQECFVNFSTVAKQNLERDGEILPTLIMVGEKGSDFLTVPYALDENNIKDFIISMQDKKQANDTKLIAYIAESNNRHNGKECFRITITTEGMIATCIYPFIKLDNGKIEHDFPVASEIIANDFIYHILNKFSTSSLISRYHNFYDSIKYIKTLVVDLFMKGICSEILVEPSSHDVHNEKDHLSIEVRFKDALDGGNGSLPLLLFGIEFYLHLKTTNEYDGDDLYEVDKNRATFMANLDFKFDQISKTLFFGQENTDGEIVDGDFVNRDAFLRVFERIFKHWEHNIYTHEISEINRLNKIQHQRY